MEKNERGRLTETFVLLTNRIAKQDKGVAYTIKGKRAND